MTFLAARRQNITLKEDFNQKSEVEFNEEFFLRKAGTSLSKCLIMLEKSGQSDSVMAGYVKEMQEQLWFNQFNFSNLSEQLL